MISGVVMGEKYGRITPLMYTGHDKHGNALFLCACECGGVKWGVAGATIRRGNVRSCGCLQRERARAANTKHGESRRTAEYGIWAAIKRRCMLPTCADYRLYGARGISICQEWSLSFVKFLQDMGRRPSPAHSIDRIDVNGNYEPSNCRWVTASEQARNKRTTRWVEFRGRAVSLAEACELSGLTAETIHRRLAKLMPSDERVWAPGRVTWRNVGSKRASGGASDWQSEKGRKG